MRTFFNVAVLGYAASALFSSLGSAATIAVTVDPADYSITSAGLLNQTGSTSRIGYSSSSLVSANAFYVYALPNLQGQTLTNAHTNVVATGKSGGTAFNGDLYALGVQSAVGASDVPNRYYEGASDTTATLIQDNLLKSGSTYASSGNGSASGTDTTGDAALLTYIQAFYTANPTYDASTQQYLILRLNADSDSSVGGATDGYTVQMKESTAGLSILNTLTLTTTATPEPASLGLLGGAVALLVRRRRA